MERLIKVTAIEDAMLAELIDTTYSKEALA